MKVIQLADGFYPLIGGGSLAIRTWIENMPYIEFEVVTNALPQQPLLEKYPFSSNCQIKRFLPADIKYSGVYKNNLRLGLFPYKLLSEYIRFNRKIKYLETADYDILHFNGPLTNYAFFSYDRLLKRTLFTKCNKQFNSIDKPKVLTFHGLPSEFTQNKIDNENEESMIKIFDYIICVERYIATKVKLYSEDNSLDKEVFFIPNSVDTTLFEFVPKILTDDEKLKVGFVGRLTEDRGLNYLINLLKNFPSFIKIYIIGLGNDELIKQYLVKIPPDQIKFVKSVPYELMPKLLREIDILFNPVKVPGISRASLESMACGTPVIMVKNGDRYPTINHKTGFIIEENIDELLDLLEYLYQNKNILRGLGRNGRKIIEREFSNDIIIQKIRNIYSEMI